MFSILLSNDALETGSEKTIGSINWKAKFGSKTFLYDKDKILKFKILNQFKN